MTGRAKLWRAAAVAFTVINGVGGIYAAVLGEWMHALGHVAALGAGYVAWRFIRSRGKPAPALAEFDDKRLDNLEGAIDSIALNVERIGEAQRFQEKILKERAAR